MKTHDDPQRVKIDGCIAYRWSTTLAISSNELAPVNHAFNCTAAITQILSGMAYVGQFPVQQGCKTTVMNEDVVKTEVPSVFRLPTYRYYAANSFSC